MPRCFIIEAFQNNQLDATKLLLKGSLRSSGAILSGDYVGSEAEATTIWEKVSSLVLQIPSFVRQWW